MRTSVSIRLFLCSVAVVGTLALPAGQRKSVPSPEEFFGFAMGAEDKLAGWDRMVEYFRAVDLQSDRVVVQELGKTTMGRPYIMAIVSSPDTIAQLPKYQAMQKRMADPRKTPPEEAARIARTGKAVVMIGTSVHSNEIGGSQMANKLVHYLATERSPWIDHVLANVILLLVPSQNPDGQQLIVDWQARTVGTPYEDSPLPELYHKYAGHDNNRDSYMLTQVETRLLTRVTYHDWLPEVYLDKHQMGSTRARIFVPPFKSPANPNVDPLVWSQVNLLGQAMATKLHEAGKSGVIWGEQYTGFWQGANSTNPWWHNMVALLTEVASARIAATVVQEEANPVPATGRLRINRDPLPTDLEPAIPLAPPTDTQARMNYTQPWLGGRWTFADVIDYQFISTLGLLEGVANNREMLKRNFYLMNRRAIDLYTGGSPFAFVIPTGQRDRMAAAKLVELLQAEAAEVHRADAPFEADGRSYEAGTLVVLLAQPFGRWVKDLLEPQRYPDIRWPYPSAPIDRPYDVTGWTLGMLMDVETVQVNKPFQAQLTLLNPMPRPQPGRVIGDGPVYAISHQSNGSIVAMNRLLKDGASISWSAGGLTADGEELVPGTILVRHARAATLRTIADDLSLDITTIGEPNGEALRIDAPRVALFEPWGGNIDAGWTRWVLDQHEFPYVHARVADIRVPDLLRRFDVIIIPEMTPSQIIRGLQGRNIPPPYAGGIDEDGSRNLREFVQAGGTVITLGNAAEFAIQQLGAPFVNVLDGVNQDEFYCPGSILRIAVDTRHPIGYGMPERADAMFINNGGYREAADLTTSTTTAVAQYAASDLLRSGWIIGEEKLRGSGAVLEAAMGRGRVIMHTFRVQSRGQTWGTFKLLFNSIFYGPAVAGRPAFDTTQAAALPQQPSAQHPSNF